MQENFGKTAKHKDVGCHRRREAIVRFPRWRRLTRPEEDQRQRAGSQRRLPAEAKIPDVKTSIVYPRKTLTCLR